MRNGPMYASLFQRPPSQLSLDELRQLGEELLHTQAHIDYDIQQLLDKIERREQ